LQTRLQVGDPSLYATAGQPATGGKLWTTLAADPTLNTGARQAWVLDISRLGADASGSAAAALAAASVALSKVDAPYSQQLLEAAFAIYSKATSWVSIQRPPPPPPPPFFATSILAF
jgi:hypothetical protein